MLVRDKFLAFGRPHFTEAEISAVVGVLRSGWIGMGSETMAFERELEDYLGCPEVVTVNSCTSGLFLSLLLEGVGIGDEVIVPSLTWCSTVNAVLYLGAKPVFCDVEAGSMLIDSSKITEKLSRKTKAVIVVHYAGLAIDVSSLRASLPEHVAIIEDAAHAFGARYPSGERVGTSGNKVCFSFYANKNLSVGDGGAIALANSDEAEQLRSLRLNGLNSDAWARYITPNKPFVDGISKLGYKMNLTDLQSAIGRVQLRRFDSMSESRKNLVSAYVEMFRDYGIPICFQNGLLSDYHARHLVVGVFDPIITHIRRDELLLALRERNIGASIHYRPLHIQPLYRPYADKLLPITESLGDKIMTLPISSSMNISDVDYVVSHLISILRDRGFCNV